LNLKEHPSFILYAKLVDKCPEFNAVRGLGIAAILVYTEFSKPSILKSKQFGHGGSSDMDNPLNDAYRVLEESIIHYQGKPVGTVASHDPDAPAANYTDCFVRDFVPSAFVFLLDGRGEIVRNFLEVALQLRETQEEIEGHENIPRVMPASFKVITHEDGREELHADFGDRAIGRVAPVDSMMWWVLLVQAYAHATGDEAFIGREDVQRGLRLITGICLRDRFEVFPTLLVPDGCFMIDRRMSVYGHPLEIQALFYASLNAAKELLTKEDELNKTILEHVEKRLSALTDYVRHYYWLDPERLNEIHRYKTELFGHDAANTLNIHPESIPDWVVDWLPDDAGYLVGNLGPGRMDFRYFAFGNLLAIIFGLATEEQAAKIMELYTHRWPDLMGVMPVKILYPAMVGKEWQLLTGSDPKNSPWSYHNGGNWPTLMWAFIAAALKTERVDLAQHTLAVADLRLSQDHWPEYYDGRNGRLIGRRANFNQTWSATAYILGHKFLDDPDCLHKLSLGGVKI